MSERREIWWCIQEPGRAGKLLPWSASWHRHLAIWEFIDGRGMGWDEAKQAGFRPVKLDVRTIERKRP